MAVPILSVFHQLFINGMVNDAWTGSFRRSIMKGGQV